ncbi:hypothetical protein KBB89_00285 [Candidatus Gracilibacteria bacterium]|nr:hypothetical protein [Candidatus Gracilibacteria bacterium]
MWGIHPTLEQDASDQIKKGEESDKVIPENLFQQIFTDLQSRVRMKGLLPEACPNVSELIQIMSTKLMEKIPGQTTGFQIPVRNFTRQGNMIFVTYEVMPGKGGSIWHYKISDDEQSVTFEREEETQRWMS